MHREEGSDVCVVECGRTTERGRDNDGEVQEDRMCGVAVRCEVGQAIGS